MISKDSSEKSNDIPDLNGLAGKSNTLQEPPSKKPTSIVGSKPNKQKTKVLEQKLENKTKNESVNSQHDKKPRVSNQSESKYIDQDKEPFLVDVSLVDNKEDSQSFDDELDGKNDQVKRNVLDPIQNDITSNEIPSTLTSEHLNDTSFPGEMIETSYSEPTGRDSHHILSYSESIQQLDSITNTKKDASMKQRFGLSEEENKQANGSQNESCHSISSKALQSPNFPTFGDVIPIKSLTKDLKNWTIYARVSNKTEINNFRNKQGPNKEERRVFSVGLVDLSSPGGEICLAFFDAYCDCKYEFMKVGGSYLISGGLVEKATKPSHGNKHPFYIIANPKNAPICIVEHQDENQYQQPVVSKDVSKEELVSFKAVVRKIGPKEWPKGILRRIIMLQNMKTLKHVCLVLWEDNADNFKFNVNDIIFLENFKFTEYKGNLELKRTIKSTFYYLGRGN